MSCLLVRYESDCYDLEHNFLFFSITYGKLIALQWPTIDFCESICRIGTWSRLLQVVAPYPRANGPIVHTVVLYCSAFLHMLFW